MTEVHYQVGIVGCGAMGEDHARAYREDERTSVTAAAEPDDGTRKSFADEYDVSRTFAGYESMLKETDLDIVSVCTWSSTHARITVDAAEAGVAGVFCEKPMATSLGEAQAMIEAAERNDVVLTVGHQRRYHPVHETVRKLIADGAIGTPTLVRAAHADGLLNWGSHLIDLGRFFLNDPETAWVMGQFERETDRHERGEPIEDRAVGQVCFETGERLTIETDLPGPDATDSALQIYGTAGSIDVCLGSHVTLCNEQGTVEYAPETENPSRFAYLEDMLTAMNTDSHEHRCSGRQALSTVEIIMAIYESARTRGLVRTPLRTKANPLKVMLERGALAPEHPGEYDIRVPYRGLNE